MVWNAEALARAKKLPPFERFAGTEPVRRQQSVDEMKAVFRSLMGGHSETPE